MTMMGYAENGRTAGGAECSSGSFSYPAGSEPERGRIGQDAAPRLRMSVVGPCNTDAVSAISSPSAVPP